jgi:uncharacterized protein
MKIGVVSDTHRNTELLGRVVEWLSARQGVSALYHLGDEYEDMAAVGDTYLDVVQVPGIYHPGYRDGSLPAKVIETVLGLRILLLHSSEKDLGSDDLGSADVVLSGHTHRPELRVADGRLYMNPGHLKADVDKQAPATFGVLDVQDLRVSAAIHNMKFAVVERMELIRSETGLYRAS